MPFDLSQVFFITTANVLDTIPGPLRDRMEIISLSGYTDDEKLEIAKRYLVPRQLEANGLKPEQAEISDAALREIIDHYTREAGVRNLEREIGRALRNAAVEIAEGKAERVTIDAADLAGDARAAALRERGGDADERARRRDRPRLDAGRRRHPVHRGDAHARHGPADPHRPARRRDEGERAGGAEPGQEPADSLGIDPALFEKSDIHIHVPAGAIPKDGPSAGVAMAIALVSLLTDRTIRSDTAMTGEISLRGLVLPVGGIKEKSAAAARAGLTRVMLPARNMKDLEDISDDARRQLEFIPLERIDDAIEAALEPAAEARKSRPRRRSPQFAGRARSRARLARSYRETNFLKTKPRLPPASTSHQ